MADNQVETAKNYMVERKSNCAQSSFRVFAEKYGLDEVMALRISQGFGGGMGHTGHVCGAVTGAYMALGLANPASKENPRQSVEKTYALVNEFDYQFKELHGTVNCTELLGYDLSKPEKVLEARGKGLFTTLCPQFVADAVRITEDLLK
jgi:C_GCAxxG_C_C family probable redox protein